MEIKKINLGAIDENCYLVKKDTGVVVIDPGFYSDEISDFLHNNADKERLILLTHCHYDHIGAALKLSEETNTKIAVGIKDSAGLTDNNINLSAFFRQPLKPFMAHILLENNQVIKVGDIEIKTIHTPGHTMGSVCYLIENHLFSGDTLFYLSYGRTDFPGGNSADMIRSFYSLTSTLAPETIVHPGHGEDTTVSFEIKHNPLNDMSAL